MANEKEPTILEDEQDVLREQRFQEQCFLLDFYEKFAKRNTVPTGDRSKGLTQPKHYEHFTQIMGPPGIILSKLLGTGVKELFNISPAQLSLLQPKISLFKTLYTKEGKQLDAELFFNDFYDQKNITKITTNRGQRGGGIGLRKFEWEDMGTNPGDSGKAFAATLQLHMQTANAIFDEQEVPGGTVSFADLLRTPPRKFERENVYNDKHFRIKIQVGYRVPPNAIPLFDRDLLRAIENSTITLFLSLIEHEIDFQENGTVDLTINYIGAIEGKLLTPESDILYISKAAEDQIQNTERLIGSDQDRAKQLERTVAAEGGRKGWFGKGASFFGIGEVSQNQLNLENLEESVEKRIQTKENLIRENRGRSYRRLLESLERSGRIFYVDVDREQIQLFGETQAGDQLSRSATAELRAERIKKSRMETRKVKFKIQQYDSPSRPDVLKKTIAASIKEKDEDERKELFDAADEKLSRSNTPQPNDMVRVNFVYFGDIVNAALSVLNQRDKNNTHIREDDSEQFRFLMGPLEILNPLTQEKDIIALADVPISLNLFHAWFLKKVIRPQLSKYFIRDFLRDICSELVVRALSPACFGNANAKGTKNRVSFSTFTLPKSGNGNRDPLGPGSARVDIGTLPVRSLRSSQSKMGADLRHYFMIYVSGYAPDQLTGDYNQDTNDGVYHLLVGADRGLVKSVKFSRTDVQYLKEARITNEEATRKGDLFLSEPYNSAIRMAGNSIFKPGMLVYVDPNSVGMGRNVPKKQRLPLGGYYTVIKVFSEIAPGKFDTSMDLNWVSFGTKEEPREPARKTIPADGTGLGGLTQIDDPPGIIARRARNRGFR